MDIIINNKLLLIKKNIIFYDDQNCIKMSKKELQKNLRGRENFSFNVVHGKINIQLYTCKNKMGIIFSIIMNKCIHTTITNS